MIILLIKIITLLIIEQSIELHRNYIYKLSQLLFTLKYPFMKKIVKTCSEIAILSIKAAVLTATVYSLKNSKSTV